MKQAYFLLLMLFSCAFMQAQIVNIPDANFKNALLNNTVADFDGDGVYDGDVDVNNDGEIQISEALSVVNLNISSSNISDLTGIEAFLSLEYLLVEDNNLSSFDISSLSNLVGFIISNNQLIEVNEMNLPIGISFLDCSHNNISLLDVSNLPNIGPGTLDCSYNPLTSLVIGGYMSELYCTNTHLTHLDLNGYGTGYTNFSDNPFLESINLKNNHIGYPGEHDIYEGEILVETITYYDDISFSNCPNLKFICVDSELEKERLLNAFQYSNYSPGFSGTPVNDIIINTYCSFSPGGEYFEIQGNTKLDLDNNGCDVLDTDFPNLKLNITDGSDSGSVIAGISGNYSLPVVSGSYTIASELENTDYFNISPLSFTVDFPTDTTPFNQDFCVTVNGVKNDMEIILIPLEQARPGFDANYELLIKNKGNTTLSGDFNLTFNDDEMDLVIANPAADSQTVGSLTWNYTNLQPFQMQSVLFTMNINTPTDANFPVNGGDILSFSSLVNPVSGDELPGDNSFSLTQTVVNSYDPNDKTCMQGAKIAPDQVGDYVHYTIRFENTGTASAVNIVVKDEIDLAKYDISTLVPLKGSHDFVTRIRDTNIVEFIFENINLPEDDANNDGYVVFKIKTQPTLVSGDTFSNKAEIYFDFNAPIITNDAITTVANLLGNESFDFSNRINIYPNPATSDLNIKGENIINSIQVLDVKGSVLLLENNINSKNTTLNIQDLKTGLYFIKVNSGTKTQTLKFVKE